MNPNPLRPLIVLITGLILIAGPAVAQDDESVIDQLNLTTVQREQVRKLREEFRTQTQEVRTSIKSIQQQVRKLKSANPPNEAALRQKLREQADKEIELSLMITRFQQQLEAILTPDQRRLLKKLQDDRQH